MLILSVPNAECAMASPSDTVADSLPMSRGCGGPELWSHGIHQRGSWCWGISLGAPKGEATGMSQLLFGLSG